MSLMEMFTNPDTIEQLSFGDKMAGAGITTLMGMGVTFVILLILWGCIAVMSKALKVKGGESKAPAAAAAIGSAPVAATAPAAASVQAVGGEELIAVISAAIAAFEGEAAASGLVVRRIIRTTGETPAWANAGHSDCLASRQR